jgi:tetraacyldisaccharide 4'-kinase
LFRVSELASPVISVGNLTAGGTGKTPLVEFIAQALAHKGKKVCVLTRGYRRQKGRQRVLVSDGQRVLADAIEAGDEPRLLAESLLGTSAVISDADRFAAGQWAERNLGCEVFVLDDGFQHRRLVRNLDIVAIDATGPWGNGHFIPWGRLREPPRGLSRADCVVITRRSTGCR